MGWALALAFLLAFTPWVSSADDGCDQTIPGHLDIMDCYYGVENGILLFLSRYREKPVRDDDSMYSVSIDCRPGGHRATGADYILFNGCFVELSENGDAIALGTQPVCGTAGDRLLFSIDTKALRADGDRFAFWWETYSNGELVDTTAPHEIPVFSPTVFPSFRAAAVANAVLALVFLAIYLGRVKL